MKIPHIYLPLAAFLFVGCNKVVPPEPMPLRPVHTLRVAAPQADVSRTFSGQVTASESSVVAFQVSGRVIDLPAKAGQSYAEGAVLAQLDASDYQTQLGDAQARMSAAKNTLRRTQGLFENENASKGDLDSAMSAERSARAAVELAQKGVNDCTLVMPYDGVIGRVDINAQETISAGQSVMSILSNGGSLEFNIGVPADLVDQISTGMAGSVAVRAIQGEPIGASVSEIGGQPGSNTTYPVTLSFASDHAGIREGMDGEAILSLPNPAGSVMTVPLSCVAALPGDTAYVYKVVVASDGASAVVERQEVETGGVREDGLVEIIEGLSEGDLIVSRGVHRLEPGTKVLPPVPANSNQ